MTILLRRVVGLAGLCAYMLTVRVSPCCVVFAPARLYVQVRIPEQTSGEVCIVMDGPDSVSSCWEQAINSPTLIYRELLISTPGHYDLQARTESAGSNVIQIEVR